MRDRYAKQDTGARLLLDLERIDGAIFSVAFGETRTLLEVAEARGFPVMIQGPLFAGELERLLLEVETLD
ncbi:MAG: hypothetical protein ACOC0O_03275 [Spirochaetota bacterium]